MSQCLHGYVLPQHSVYIEDIYFFGVNTKYISKSAMKNQYSVVSPVSSTSENADIFIARDEIHLVLSETK